MIWTDFPRLHRPVPGELEVVIHYRVFVKGSKLIQVFKRRTVVVIYIPRSFIVRHLKFDQKVLNFVYRTNALHFNEKLNVENYFPFSLVKILQCLNLMSSSYIANSKISKLSLSIILKESRFNFRRTHKLLFGIHVLNNNFTCSVNVRHWSQLSRKNWLLAEYSLALNFPLCQHVKLIMSVRLWHSG